MCVCVCALLSAQVKENLLSCKMLLHCKRDELRKLWIEGVEHKHVLSLLDEIENIKQVPQKLEASMASKHYLHATDMLVSVCSNVLVGETLFIPWQVGYILPAFVSACPLIHKNIKINIAP